MARLLSLACRRSARRQLALVTAGVTAVALSAVVVAVPAAAGTNATSAARPHGGAAPGDHHARGHGKNSTLAAATAQARRTHRRVHVTSLDTTSSTTYANTNGTVTKVLTQAPTRTRVGGKLVKIDTALQLSHGRLAPKAATARVSLRATASHVRPTSRVRPVTRTASAAGVDSGGGTADVASLDPPGPGALTMGYGTSLDAPSVSGSTATYALSATSSLVASTLPDGFDEDVVLAAAPASAPVYRFPITVAGGLTPRLRDGVLEFDNPDGTVAALSRPLHMWDAHRDSAGDPSNTSMLSAALTQTGGGWELDLTPDLAYLTDPGTQYPVTIDPTVVLSYNYENDIYYYNGNTTNHGGDYWLSLGRVTSTSSVIDRTYINWNTSQFVGEDVTSAKLSLWQYTSNSCSAKNTAIYPTTSYSNLDSANVTINNDSAWSQQQAFNTGGGGCTGQPDGYDNNIDVTKIVAGWASGEVPQYAMELRAGDASTSAGAGATATENDSTYYKRFCSRNAAPAGTGHCEGTTETPSLAVTYAPDLGQQPQYPVLQHRLNDRSQLAVNTRNGDAVLRASDIHLGGRGLDLSVDRFYNSLDSRSGQFGAGWRMSVGPDVYLSRDGSNDRWDYHAPGGGSSAGSCGTPRPGRRASSTHRTSAAWTPTWSTTTTAPSP